MSGPRNKNAWIWVAIAAIAFASAARAEAGLQNARAGAHPVLEFLARSQGQNPAAFSGVLRFAHLGSGRQSGFMSRNARTGALMTMFPVLFIGLISPLALARLASIRCIRRLGRALDVLRLSSLFQRPPPIFA